MRRFHPIVKVLFVIVLTSTAYAQEFRATLNGRVTDPSKDVIPGATVSITNTETNQTIKVITNAEGNYTVPFLNPGTYSITVEATGFKKHVHNRQALQVGQTATLNIELALGEASETVTVTAENALLEEAKADRGVVIDNSVITELPLNSRNPFMLAALVAGVTFNDNSTLQRPFDNGGTSSFSINGGATAGNQFLLDGAPNNAMRNGNSNVAFMPPVDAVQEFKISTNAYDAQYGKTGGGIINVSLKSGGNEFHGSAYEFARRNFLDANDLLSNTRGIPVGKAVKADGTFTDAKLRLDQYGFQLNGPVVIPKIYGRKQNGTHRTFFLFNFEDYREKTPNPAIRTVPPEEFLRGDFSNFRDATGKLIVIYDPATGRQVGNQWVRDPFPGNKIPENRIHPLARKLIPYFPKPNTNTPGREPWRNNFTDIPNLAADTFHNWVFKIDQSIGTKDKVFFRFGYNTRTEMAPSNGITEGPAQHGQLPLIRANHNGVVDWVHTFSSSLVLNLRSSANRFYEIEEAAAGLGFDATELGFPKSLVDQLPMKMFPRIEISDFTRLGRGSLDIEPSNVFTFQPNVVWMRGAHSLRSGLDFRLTQYSRLSSGEAGMRLNFNRNFTRRIYNSGSDSGSSLASFLLGAVADGGVDYNVATMFMWKYYAPWIQDDWKVNSRLTLNFGLRWDIASPLQERFNRQSYIFDTTAINPVSQRVDKTAFPQFANLQGGLRFLGVDGSPTTPWAFDSNNVQPRIGFAFKLDDKTVLRGGFGRFYLDPTSTGHTQGFTIRTPLVASIDNNRTPISDYARYFPDGIAQPPGSSQGLETLLGREISFANPNFEIPFVHSVSLGIQKELGSRTVIDVSYVGSRTYRQGISFEGINEPSVEFRNKCDITLGGDDNLCDEQIPNPFYHMPGFESAALYNNMMASRYQLSRPFPQFPKITETQLNEGKSWYNSLQVVVNRRLKGDLTIAGSYTFSKTMEEGSYVDHPGRVKNRSIAGTDRTHRITMTGVYYLPIGRGKRFLPNMPSLLQGLIGGWELAGAWIYESGLPWTFRNSSPYLTYLGGAEIPDSERKRFINGIEYIQGVKPCIERLNTTAGSPNYGSYELIPNSVAYGCTGANFRIVEDYQRRLSPLRDSRIRRPSYTQFDMNFAKNLKVGEKKSIQLRFEVFNVLNSPMYNRREYNNDPNSAEFGAINKGTTAQNNYGRQIQLAAKFIF